MFTFNFLSSLSSLLWMQGRNSFLCKNHPKLFETAPTSQMGGHKAFICQESHPSLSAQRLVHSRWSWGKSINCAPCKSLSDDSTKYSTQICFHGFIVRGLYLHKPTSKTINISTFETPKVLQQAALVYSFIPYTKLLSVLQYHFTDLPPEKLIVQPGVLPRKEKKGLKPFKS